MFRPMQPRSRARDPSLLFLLLAIGQQVQRLPVKPPVTLALAAFQIAVHVADVPGFTAPLQQVCIHAGAILRAGLLSRDAWRRLLTSPFLHADDMHLYYNMASLLWKGTQLEQRFGSSYAVIMAALLLLSQLYAVAIALAAARIGGHHEWMQECGVGFSGVLFGMKVLLTADSDGQENVSGFTVPAKWAAWAELLLIYFLVPRSSFLGHLAGILAGLTLVMLMRYAPHLHRVWVRLVAAATAPQPVAHFAAGQRGVDTSRDAEIARMLQEAEDRAAAGGRAGPSDSDAAGAAAAAARERQNMYARYGRLR